MNHSYRNIIAIVREVVGVLVSLLLVVLVVQLKPPGLIMA